MGGDYRQKRPSSSSSYFSAGCMSPSCVPVHEEYTRIDIACSRRSRRLRKLIKKIMAESKTIYSSGPKPITFQYDAVSYAQNFDDGSHLDEYPRCQKAALPAEQRWQHHSV